MEKSLQTRIGYFFIGVLIVTILGFYKTYLVTFPDFAGFTSAHHFHGAVALTWILMLIVQPFLIRAGKYDIHRLVGKFSYLVMPLFVISLFFVVKAGYERNIKTLSVENTLAAMTNGIPEMFFMTLLFGLGMYYKNKTAFHLRFLSSTGIIILGPGLGRFLGVNLQLPLPIIILLMISLTAGIALVWLIMDIRQKKSAFPMATLLIICFIAAFIGSHSHSVWWQGFAGWFVTAFF
jgi:hypothetical protein